MNSNPQESLCVFSADREHYVMSNDNVVQLNTETSDDAAEKFNIDDLVLYVEYESDEENIDLGAVHVLVPGTVVALDEDGIWIRWAGRVSITADGNVISWEPGCGGITTPDQMEHLEWCFTDYLMNSRLAAYDIIDENDDPIADLKALAHELNEYRA
jgi:hypothetical protein